MSQSAIFSGLENEGFGTQTYVQNRCIIRPNIDPNFPDLSKIRILARKGNDGSFFVVDEFDPKSDVTRTILGASFTVYDASSREYKFYNDRLGSAVPVQTVNKMFDNVPFKAQGQALAGNRLMYSNYTEGRANNPVSSGRVDLDPVYSEISTGSKSLIASSDSSNVIAQMSPSPQIKIDLIGGAAFDSLTGGGTASTTTVIPAGTRIDFSFVFKPTFTITAASGNLISFDAREDDPGGGPPPDRDWETQKKNLS